MVESITNQTKRHSFGAPYESYIPSNKYLPLQLDGVKTIYRDNITNAMQEDIIRTVSEAEVIYTTTPVANGTQQTQVDLGSHLQLEAKDKDILLPPCNMYVEQNQEVQTSLSHEAYDQQNLPENGLGNNGDGDSYSVPESPSGSSSLVFSVSGSSSSLNLAAATPEPPVLDLTTPPVIPEPELSSVLTTAEAPDSENSANPLDTAIVAIAGPAAFEAALPSSTRLRQIIANSPEILVCPGVYDGLSARIAISVGFSGLYMTGAGTTASRLGAADLGIAQLHDMRTNAEMISNLSPEGFGPPLIADMDTGYGGPLIISRAVQAYVRAGVAGFHIEDQVTQKRCGHLQGKEVVDIDTYIQRIKACVIARRRMRSDIVIIARTDANQSRGYSECIERLRRARDEGADVGILEGFASKEQARQAVQDLAPWPLCLNSVENGVSPLISVQEAQDMGFRIIIFSFAALAPAYVSIKHTLERLRNDGVTGTPKDVTPKTIFEVCGLDEEMEMDRATGGSAFAKGV